MATTQCLTCNEETSTFICRGCEKNFCFNHLTEHRQFLHEKFHLIQDEFNQFMIDIRKNPVKHSLFEEIDRWENNSIDKIKEKAKQCREELINYTNENIHQIEMKLIDTNQQFQTNQKKINDFYEIQRKIGKIKRRTSSTKKYFDQTTIKFIYLEQSGIQNLNINQKWKTDGTTIVGGHGQGNGLNQLFGPNGMFIDDDQTIYVADTYNQRILQWKKNEINGRIVAGGNGQGNRNDQLNRPTQVIVDKKNDSLIICDLDNRRVVQWPRQNGQTGVILISNIYCSKLAIDDDGYLYVSDYGKHEVRRWKIGEMNGVLIAGGNGQGNRLDQLNLPKNIFIDQDQSVYVSNGCNHRVMKWIKGAKEGIIVAGGQGEGNCLNQLSDPFGIIVDQLGSVYIADFGNHRVIRWLKGAREGTILVGGNGQGQQPNQLSHPIDLSFDQQNNLYVLDSWNNRVQKFDAY
jgi:sugar lactone lactonase YvrE